MAAICAAAILITCISLAGAAIEGICPECGSSQYDSSRMTQATCTEPCIVYYRCLEPDCGHTWERAVPGLEALGHWYEDEWTITKEPSCTGEGERQLKCRRAECGHIEIERLTVLPHSLIEQPGRDADCTEAGKKTSWLCSVCGQLFSDEEGKAPAAENDLVIDAAGHSWKETEVPASCTTDGTIVERCEKCGEEGEAKAGQKASGHDMELKEGYPATCTEDGLRDVYECRTCGGRFLDVNGESKAEGPDVLKARGHKLQHTALAAASCTEGGVAEHWTCRTCGVVFRDPEAAIEMAESPQTEPSGHALTYVSGKDASCELHGSIEYWYCTECGKYFVDDQSSRETSFEDTALPAKGHSLEHCPYITAAENMPGQSEHWKCTECGKLFGDENAGEEVRAEDVFQEPMGHSLIRVEPKAAGCTEPGTEAHYACTGCGAKFFDEDGNEPAQDTYLEIPASGHSYIDTVVPPDCAEGGYTEHVCAECGASLRDTGTDPKGHTTVYVPEKSPSHDEPGTHNHWVCLDCGAVFADKEASVPAPETVIPPKGHEYVDSVASPTCTESGYTEHICEGCGDTYRDTETAPAGHTLKHVDEVKAAAQTPGCIAHWECEVCGLRFRDDQAKSLLSDEELEIPPPGHTYEDKVIPPTCTEDGYTEHVCSDCGDTYRDNEVVAFGHNLRHVNEAKPTAETPGRTEHWECEKCGLRFRDKDAETPVSDEELDIPPLGHTYENRVVMPTCTEGGYTEHKCTDEGCESTYMDLETDPLGHDMTRHPAQAPTLTREGSIEYWECSRCGGCFTDADGANEVERGSVVRPKLEQSQSGGSTVATGDDKDVVMYVVLGLGAAVAAALILFRMKRKSKTPAV